MIWLVLSVIIGLVSIGFALIGVGPWRVVGPVVGVVVWIVMTVALSLHTVGQREVGIVQSFSGTIGSNYKSSGVVMTAPWNHILKENIGIQKEVFEFTASNSAVSKDQQPIEATLVVNYQVEPKQVIRLYKTVGPSWKNVLLDGRIPQDFKETTAQFSSPDITLQRPRLRKITLARLRQELGKYDIRIVDVFVNNVSYSKDYTTAIEEKLVQRQHAQQAEAKVAQATAEANQKIQTAIGEARSIELEGKALQGNPEVLRLRAINAINKKATIIFCSSGDCPSILSSSLVPAQSKK